MSPLQMSFVCEILALTSAQRVAKKQELNATYLLESPSW